jgi:L-xylulose reductase
MVNILIAGTGKGIGKSTADLIFSKNHGIVAVSRTEVDLKDRPYPSLVSDLVNPDCIPLLKKYEDWADVVVNCTGIYLEEKEINDIWKSNIMKLIEQNVRPALHIYQSFLDSFRKRRKGHFIHISSGALDFYDETESGYCASKSALESIILTLQNGDNNQKTNVIHHAFRVALTDTPLARRECLNVSDWNNIL